MSEGEAPSAQDPAVAGRLAGALQTDEGDDAEDDDDDRGDGHADPERGHDGIDLQQMPFFIADELRAPALQAIGGADPPAPVMQPDLIEKRSGSPSRRRANAVSPAGRSRHSQER